MHDTAALEEKGLATAFVASEVFRQASDSQAKALGTKPSPVYVPHPIQDRTDNEMRELADAAVDELISALVSADA